MSSITSAMNFGQAIEALKSGEKVARKGWNSRNMFIILVGESPNISLKECTPYQKALNNESQCQGTVTINQHIDMFTATGEFQPGWLASQADMLSHDWEIV